ncbi:ATP-binding protein [Streptomyces sp. NBC_00433]
MSTTPSAARSFVRDTLQAWDLRQLIEQAEVIAGELVTNAVKATRHSARHKDSPASLATVSIELHLDDSAFRIAVRDSSTEQPALQVVGEDAEGGRGLFLVEALSTRWDAFPVTGGKVTWAELDSSTPADV